MADEKEILLQTLVTKFKVDPESAREAIAEARQLLEQQRLDAKGLMTLEAEDLLAAGEAKKEQQRRHLESVEVLIKQHYNKLLSNQEMSQEERAKAQQDFDADMATNARRKEHIDGDITGMERAKAALFDFRRAATNILPGIGLGFVTTMFSTAAIAANLKQAADRLREMDTIGRGLAFGAGQFGTGFAPTMSRGLEDLHLETGISGERLRGVTSTFTPITGPGVGGAAQAVEMTRQAIGMGAATGVGEQAVAAIMVKLRQLDDIPTDKLGDAFTHLANTAFDAGVPVGEYATYVTGLTEQTKKYGIGLEDNMRLVSLFARELQTGIVGIGDLLRLQTGFARAPEGARAFATTEIMSRGLGSERLRAHLASMGGDPVAMAFEGRRIAEGGLEKEMPGVQDELTAALTLLAEGMAEDVVGPGGNPARIHALTEKFTEDFMQKFGLIGDPTIEAAHLLKEAALDHKTASKGWLEVSKRFEGGDEATDIGIQYQVDSLGEIKKIGLNVEGIWNAVGRGAQDVLDREGYKERIEGNRDYMRRSLSSESLSGTTPEAMFRRLQPIIADDPRSLFEVGKEMGFEIADSLDISSGSRTGRGYRQKEKRLEAVLRADFGEEGLERIKSKYGEDAYGTGWQEAAKAYIIIKNLSKRVTVEPDTSDGTAMETELIGGH